MNKCIKCGCPADFDYTTPEGKILIFCLPHFRDKVVSEALPIGKEIKKRKQIILFDKECKRYLKEGLYPLICAPLFPPSYYEYQLTTVTNQIINKFEIFANKRVFNIADLEFGIEGVNQCIKLKGIYEDNVFEAALVLNYYESTKLYKANILDNLTRTLIKEAQKFKDIMQDNL